MTLVRQTHFWTFCLLVALTGCQSSPSLSPLQGPLSEANKQPQNPGEKLFLLHCAGCHHVGGFSPNNIVTLAKKSAYVGSEQDFIAFLRAKKPVMPTFSPQDLPDADARQIYTFIQQQLQAPKP